MRKLHLCIVVAVASWLSPCLRGESEFQPIFDGSSLAGWATPDPSYWTVEDGAITGRITKDHPCSVNQYLVWTGGELADFELRLKSRLTGEGGINNGFQFRSRLLPDHDICGYQVDNNLETPWLVRLYDEYGRHTLAWRGERTVFDVAGNRTTTKLPDAERAPWFRLEDWHEYHLVCVGTRMSLKVAGRLVAEVTDNDSRRFESQGVLALQLHSGPRTFVQFKDIQLKVLKPAVPASRVADSSAERQRAHLRGQAVAWWPLETGGHGAKPPLRHVPGWDKFELNVRAAGPGARAESKVVLLHGAYFDAGPDLQIGEGEATVYLRVRDPHGTWNSGLISKRSAHDPSPVRLFSEDLPETPGPDVGFEVSTDQGTALAAFPVSLIEATGWHDLVGRYDGESIQLYCDRRRMAAQPLQGQLKQNRSSLLIGAEQENGSVGRHFQGEMEEAGLWSRALTVAEVAALSGELPAQEDQNQAGGKGVTSPSGSVAGIVTFTGANPKSTIPDDAGVRRELLEIDEDTRGLRYVLVHLVPLNASSQKGATPSLAPPRTPPTVIDQQNHEFVPRVVAVREGELVRFTNSDAANHNVRTSSVNATNQFNVLTGIGGKYEHRFVAHPELRPIPLGCDIHPWMRGWVYVFPHDHFAVTDSTGRFEIRSVPPGKYRLILKQPDIRYSAERSIIVAPGLPTRVEVQIQDHELPKRAN